MKNQDQDSHPPGLHYHDLEAEQFRLLYILPGKYDDVLELEFNLTWLYKLEPPDSLYIPISYQWRVDQPMSIVKVAGHATEIPEELDHLMRRLRHPSGDMCKTVWIDQLCINQDDDNDKAMQIPLMRSIYQMAACVLVWLGSEGINDCQAAFGLIDKWYDLAIELGDDEGQHLEKVSLDRILGPATEENLQAYASFQQLMSLEYWERTWVLQEASASDNVFVFYGDLPEMRLERIFYARNLIMSLIARNSPPRYLLQDIPSSKVGRIQNFKLQREESTISLLDLLHTVRRTRCSDIRDKVFSMLPFASDVGDYARDVFLKPDYSRAPEDLYVDVTRWYIAKHRDLGFLGYCSSKQGLHLPSWVPDWTLTSYMTPFHRLHGSDSHVFSACGSFSSEALALSITDVPGRIEVSGIRVTTITEVCSPVIDSFPSLEVELEWKSTFVPTDSYPLPGGGETMQDAFERTVVAEMERSGYTDRGKPHYRRGGRVFWPTGGDTRGGETLSDIKVIKNASYARRLFYAGDPQIAARSKQGMIMGLGRDDVQINDEVWSLKGGDVLYILRKSDKTVTTSSQSGERTPVFTFVGDAYISGLMDGEVLRYSAQEAADRPVVLRGMGSRFNDILIE